MYSPIGIAVIIPSEFHGFLQISMVLTLAPGVAVESLPASRQKAQQRFLSGRRLSTGVFEPAMAATWKSPKDPKRQIHETRVLKI